MSEPVPPLQRAPDPAAGPAQRWKELRMDVSSSCNPTKPDLKQNGHCECSQSSDMAPGTGRDMEVHSNSQMEAEYLKKHCRDISPQQQTWSPTETSLSDELHSSFSPAQDKSDCNHLPASGNASEDCSLDLLRIVKHKPSAIVFCDYDCSADNQEIFAIESSDGGESSSSTAEEGEDDDDDEDGFPETLQYKEFLVSRRRRNLSRNRKCLRKRQDAQPNSTSSGWQKPTSKGKPEFTGSREEEDTLQNNGKQPGISTSQHALYQRASIRVSLPLSVFSHLSEQPSVAGTFPQQSSGTLHAALPPWTEMKGFVAPFVMSFSEFDQVAFKVTY